MQIKITAEYGNTYHIVYYIVLTMFIQYYYRDFVKICKTKFQETFCKILPWFMVNYLQRLGLFNSLKAK